MTIATGIVGKAAADAVERGVANDQDALAAILVVFLFSGYILYLFAIEHLIIYYLKTVEDILGITLDSRKTHGNQCQ